MIRPEHISEAVWRAAMSTYHKELRRDPGMAWQKAIAAAINAWGKKDYFVSPRHPGKPISVNLHYPQETRNE